jgi:hypothetical protein
MEFIEFIIVAGFVLYFVRMLIRLLLPMLFQGLVNKAQQGPQQRSYQQSTRADGRVKVDYAPKKKSQIPDSEGDFIDYEDIK